MVFQKKRTSSTGGVPWNRWTDMGWRTRLRASISASTFLRNSSTGTALKPAGSGAKRSSTR